MKKKFIFMLALVLSFQLVNAQKINQIEYFFDNDPGIGNGIVVSGYTSANVITNFTFPCNTSSLNNAYHTLFVRSKDSIGIWSMANHFTFLKASIPNVSNITSIEYFIDNDPGLGNATTFNSFTPDSILNNINIPVNTAALTNDFHAVFFRTKDTNGKWSITQKFQFLKIQDDVVTNINAIEYFMDNDPGIGNAIPVAGFTANTSIVNFPFSANTALLSNGFHAIFVRTKNANGKWSITQKFQFLKIQDDVVTNIDAMEYFIDNDPGIGNAIPVAGFTANTSIINFPFSANTALLNNGFHAIFVRTKDANGKWSITQKFQFLKIQDDVVTTINAMEYFMDNDPGIGNATPVSGFASNTSIINFPFSANTTLLSDGFHTIFVRTKDANGKWSITQKFQFIKLAELATPNVTKIEYFIDNDPGVGQGQDVPIVANAILNNIGINIDSLNIGYGIHRLFVRTQDAYGKWSLCNEYKFVRDYFKFFVEGFYDGGGMMKPVLMNQGVSSDPTLTDSIDVELHSPVAPYQLVSIHRGIVKTNGVVSCSFGNTTGSYYLTIRNRNTVETWSSVPILLGTAPITYDFTTASSKAYGNNMIQKGPNIWAMFSGDINSDGNIDLLDEGQLEADIESFSYGYFSTDINGDGNVDLLDTPVIELNVNNFIYTLHP